jgi:phosphatidate cytidylyltransferase
MEQVTRIVSALVIVPPLVLFLLYAPPVLFLILILALIGLSLREYFHLLQSLDLAVLPRVTVLAAWALGIMALGGRDWLALAFFLSLVALTCGVMVSAVPGSHSLPTLVYSVFGVLFIGWTLSHLMLLRLLPAGQWYVLFLCVVVWVGDSVAMYVGKSLGRHKLAPTISPGKTWEGSVGGTVGGVLTAIVSAALWLPDLGLWQCMLLGLCISIAAQMSDLGESLIKRYAGVKDSGGLIPGHGGMLDRIDSMLFAAPALVYALDLLPVSSP